MKEEFMSNKKLVSIRQADAFRLMANARGVTFDQFEVAKTDGRIGRFLDELKVAPVVITPPLGGRIYTVRIRLRPNRRWEEAVDAVGPDTPSNYEIRLVGDQYPAINVEEVDENILLLNSMVGDGFDKTLAWAESHHLVHTDPREVFAIGEQHPTLHDEQKQNPMYVAATTECTLKGNRRGACCVWWLGSKRGASTDLVGELAHSKAWFAFRESSQRV